VAATALDIVIDYSLARISTSFAVVQLPRPAEGQTLEKIMTG
jgi:hypothetical protein